MSPSALLRPCAEPLCGALVEHGRCAAHGRVIEQRRGSAHARGYTRAWERFRVWFKGALIAAGIVPACGARLPGAPVTEDSLCVLAGRLNNRRLHLDHTPPLASAERADERAVCDPMRVQFLCESCHNAKTKREEGGR